MMRLFWLALGVGALVLAVLGVVLPLLPTTPFLLVSAFAFARSSPRLHIWLINHPRLGPPILDWRRERAISRNAKVASVVAIIAAFAISLSLGTNTTVLVIQALVLSAVAVFVISRPVPSPHRDLRKESRHEHG